MANKTAKKRPEYTVELYFDKRDGSEPVRWETLTPEEIAEIHRKMEANLSSAMSRYYQAHPEALDAWR